MSRKIVEFQKANRLVSDGIIGKNTLLKMKEVFKIVNEESVAHFVGQLAHETNHFSRDTESLNYSVEGLKATFSFFRKNPHLAQQYGRISGVQNANQEAIANLVYDDANRSANYKLGNTQPGDGWKFRGRGGIQLTGRSNYEAFFKWKGISINTNPDLVATVYFWDPALWFFERNKVWWHTGSVTYNACKNVTKLVNGGDNGLADRWRLTEKYYNILN